MNPRLAKELRPLLLPWGIAAIGACGHFVALCNPVFANGAFGNLLTGLAGTAFVVGVLVLAAMPMGVELHERTLSLLLSQPTERVRLWKEKLFAASLMIALLSVIHGIASVVSGQLNLMSALLFAGFAIAAVCSVGYYTLSTRSVLIGITCAVGMPYAIVLSTYLIVRYVFGLELDSEPPKVGAPGEGLYLSDQMALVLILVAGAAYSAFFLRLSCRQFANLELRDAPVSRAAEVPTALVPRWLSNLFRARPTGVILNLIRKEVCLHKPVFLVSAIFAAVWLLTLLLMLLRPVWNDNCIATLHGLTGAQIVLMAILIGCVSLGDDKALGTTAWHLTLPLSAGRQWLIKLFVAVATLVAMAIILPILLATLALVKAQVGLLAFRDGAVWAIPFALVFVLSFWSASMVTSTVRAALTCVASLVALGGCIFLGTAVPASFFGPSSNYVGLQSGLLARISAHYQLPPDYFAKHHGVIGYAVLLASLVFVSLALVQSFKQFRRLQTGLSVKVKCAVVLALVAVGGSFWCADLNMSRAGAQAQFDSELRSALARLPHAKSLNVMETNSVSFGQLEGTGQFSPIVGRWLTDCTLTTLNYRSERPNGSGRGLIVGFPNGGTYQLVFADP